MLEPRVYSFGAFTSSLILNTAKVEDAERMVAAIDAAASQNLSFFRTPVTLERQQSYLAGLVESRYDQLFLIEELAGDKRLFGAVGLHEVDLVNRNARLGILIFNPADRGKGYSREAIRLIHLYAFEKCKLHKLYVRVLLNNAQGLAKYRHHGYRIEGVLREEYCVDGENFEDMFCLSLLKKEWEEQGKQEHMEGAST